MKYYYRPIARRMTQYNCTNRIIMKVNEICKSLDFFNSPASFRHRLHIGLPPFLQEYRVNLLFAEYKKKYARKH